MTITRKQFLLIPALGLWVAASAIPLAYLGAAHLRGLNLTSKEPELKAPVDSINPVGPRWRMVHLLVEGCGCSAAIAAHLADRQPMTDVDEVVYVVGEDHHFEWVLNLTRIGFDVRVKSADEVRRTLGTDAGPQLLIEDPTGAVKYRGGYQSTRPGTFLDHPAAGFETESPQERQILSALRQGRNVQVYPAFGCAGSLSLP